MALEISKAVVRAARREDRFDLWKMLEDGIEAAKEAAQREGDAWPWENPEDVQAIEWKDAQGTLEDAIGTIGEPAERVKLVRAAGRAYEELTAKGAGRPIKAGRYGIRVCARPSCGTRFAAKSPRHIWHSSTCRAAAFKEAERQRNGLGAENVPGRATQAVQVSPGA
jgi:hypothetical protein